MHDETSWMKQLNMRLSALKKISTYSSFKNRLMVGNGIFSSKLIYMIPLWGGCEKSIIYLILKLNKLN